MCRWRVAVAGRGVTWPKPSYSRASTLALQVFCWLVDRLGGGWTLGFTQAYHWCHINTNAQGNVNGNVLGTVMPVGNT